LRLDLKQIVALAAVLRTGSFEAAAQQLNLTASALSQRVRNQLNAPLDGVEHIRRSHEEISLWRNRPFIMNVDNVWQVRCLDGKTHDRVSNWELADNESDAVWAALLTE